MKAVVQKGDDAASFRNGLLFGCSGRTLFDLLCTRDHFGDDSTAT